jgi:mannan endo-1,4-beta-mannosidase
MFRSMGQAARTLLCAGWIAWSGCAAGSIGNASTQLHAGSGVAGRSSGAGVTGGSAGIAQATAANGGSAGQMTIVHAGRSGSAGVSAAGHSGSGTVVGGRSGGGGTTGAAGKTGAAGATNPGSHATYYVQDGLLYDRCGEMVILRGINHPTLYIDRQGTALPEIAKTGANAVRLFWYATMGIAITEAETAIKTAIANGMVPILEMHDSTCKWSLDSIVSYWTSAEAVALIQRYQANMIVNIANETNPPSETEFESTYASVVQTLRTAGIHVPLMIDGGNCGRDYKMLLSQGAALLAADPDHNLIFSGHLYDPLSQSALGGVYDSFVTAKLPFVVGEFANKEPPGCGAALDYKDLIGEANKRGIGWLAWSWGDNDPNTDWNSDCAEFDMTSTFAFSSLHDWGLEVSVTLPDSLMNTAVRPASLKTGACQ